MHTCIFILPYRLHNSIVQLYRAKLQSTVKNTVKTYKKIICQNQSVSTKFFHSWFFNVLRTKVCWRIVTQVLWVQLGLCVNGGHNCPMPVTDSKKFTAVPRRRWLSVVVWRVVFSWSAQFRGWTSRWFSSRPHYTNVSCLRTRLVGHFDQSVCLQQFWMQTQFRVVQHSTMSGGGNDNRSRKNGATKLSGMNFYGYLGHVTIFRRMLTTAYWLSNQTNYIGVHTKVDHRADQLSLPHVGITKTV